MHPITALLTTLQHADKDSYARVSDALGRSTSLTDVGPEIL